MTPKKGTKSGSSGHDAGRRPANDLAAHTRAPFSSTGGRTNKSENGVPLRTPNGKPFGYLGQLIGPDQEI